MNEHQVRRFCDRVDMITRKAKENLPETAYSEPKYTARDMAILLLDGKCTLDTKPAGNSDYIETYVVFPKHPGVEAYHAQVADNIVKTRKIYAAATKVKDETIFGEAADAIAALKKFEDTWCG